MLSETDMKKIDRENHAQARMAARDWTVVLSAVVLIAAIFGFIYYADQNGVPTSTESSAIEPAAGSPVTPAYDSEVNDTTPAPATTAPGTY